MQQLPDTIAKVLDELQKRFGATGSHFWQIYVQYFWATHLTALIINLLVLVIMVFIPTKLIKLMKEAKSDDEEWKFGIGVTGLFAFVTITIMCICNINACLPGILAPEGGALTQLLGSVK